MIYGFISSLDDETTKVFFRSKKIRGNNIYSAGSLGALTSVLQSGDVVYAVSCNRFASVRQVYTFARFCHERGIILHFVAEPYLDIGNGKQWRPAVAKVIASMVESEQKAKGMMAQGFKMSDSQWEYTYRCFELMNLDILAHLFSADGVLKRLKAVCSYFGLDGVGSHSFRKGFATNVYVNNHYNIELVRILVQVACGI